MNSATNNFLLPTPVSRLLPSVFPKCVNDVTLLKNFVTLIRLQVFNFIHSKFINSDKSKEGQYERQ